MSLAKLTSVSTKTLSLLLERQRFQTLPSFSPANNNNNYDDTSNSNPNSQSTSPAPRNTMHLQQITRNMSQLKAGIIAMEAKEGRTEAVQLLRNQYERMRGMLGEDTGVVESLEPEPTPDSSSSSSSTSLKAPVPIAPIQLIPTPSSRDSVPDPTYTPYTDDPEADAAHPSIMLQTQRQLMDQQDEHLDRLSHSVSRQHHISVQINDELDVHSGLLEELDTDLDRTGNRMSAARRRLDRVAKGAKENGSTVTIALLILVLLILIIAFKT
ncbi:hypothetical protein BDQ12DRAFT_218345 [Crucibulum laeve]|uniref:t-SNARE coiled-coil homology domain-containing protein n=1 Tax=Crucibulum laeve TaxID=68775 RepID=A0A5C3LW22_9AGAR|nr:hypothetical protein BDQ12DRAFT_218345 [Crucibulum laeve]